MVTNSLTIFGTVLQIIVDFRLSILKLVSREGATYSYDLHIHKHSKEFRSLFKLYTFYVATRLKIISIGISKTNYVEYFFTLFNIYLFFK